MPGKKYIRWNSDTMETIMAARQQLVGLGVRRPSIRMVLYLLLELPGWKKSHYDTMCSKLGEWRDKGLIEFGLFSVDGGGQGYRPFTSREITLRLQALRDMIPAQLVNGQLPIIFIEHISLVDTMADLLDNHVPVVSSQGQLRREHLYAFLQGCVNAMEELNGDGISMIALTDYDKGGTEIYNVHRRWVKRLFGIDVRRWAVTGDQVRAARLPDHEPHQLDGWMAKYGIQRLQRELREVVGLRAPPDTGG